MDILYTKFNTPVAKVQPVLPRTEIIEYVRTQEVRNDGPNEPIRQEFSEQHTFEIDTVQENSEYIPSYTLK